MRSEPAFHAHAELLDEFASDVRTGLGGPGQKKLPSRYLYDDLGSALFEAIGFLPEYGLTRADERILRAHAGAIAKAMGTNVTVAELGSGNGRKTRWILEALAAGRTLEYYPIDISSAALERCELELSRIPSLRIEPIEADYMSGLSLVAAKRGKRERLLLLFLGSTIGNFEPSEAQEFVREIRRRLRPGDGFLLGTDLVKPEPALLAAYDDSLGVTAAFNRNVLQRINRELDADFDQSLFDHEARWSAPRRRVEMHLVARQPHRVRIGAIELTVTFREGESIWTESSYKFDPEGPVRMATEARFSMKHQWVDAEWAFAESLLIAR